MPKVVILAGGFGTRLKDETKNIPKPLIVINEKPIIEHVMDLYLRYNYKEFIICCGYKVDAMMKYFLSKADRVIKNNDKELQIEFNDSNITLVDTGLNTMTGGRIKRIKDYIKDDYFFLTYCDGICAVNMNDLLDYAVMKDSVLTVTAVQPEERFGILKINEGRIEKFSEKKDDRWINGGFMVLRKDIFQYIEGDSSILEKDVVDKLTNIGSLYAYQYFDKWTCMDMNLDKEKISELIRMIK